MSLAAQINDAEVVAEITAISDQYERALIENRVEELKALFWDSPLALRFGVTEELYGADEIAAFRDQRKINFSNRRTLRREVLTLGRDLAIVTIEFGVVVLGKHKHGRQTQIWARLGDAGWRVVSAHVSHRVEPSSGKAAEYGAAASALLEIEVDPLYRDGVARNLHDMAAIAAPLMAVELPPDVEPAPRFEP